jgi:signal transduction histidine kinase
MSSVSIAQLADTNSFYDLPIRHTHYNYPPTPDAYIQERNYWQYVVFSLNKEKSRKNDEIAELKLRLEQAEESARIATQLHDMVSVELDSTKAMLAKLLKPDEAIGFSNNPFREFPSDRRKVGL